MIVDHNLVQRQTGGLRRRRLGSCEDLVADPDLAVVLADMNRAVHRLHCRMREERHLIDRVDLGNGARHGFVDIADILRNRPRIERRLFELAHDLVRVELGVWITLVEGCRPQHQDIDAPVGNSVPAQGSRDAACRMLGVPRLEPGPNALLKF
jgi:hypothetical protein